MGRHCLPRGVLSILALAVLVFTALPGQAQLRTIALGKGASSRTPKLTQDDIDGLSETSQRLFVVLNAPYEIWTDGGSYLHVAVYRSDFSPASGAVVYLDERPVGVTDSAGALAFRFRPPAPRSEIKAPSHYHVITAIVGRGSTHEARGRTGFETLPKRGARQRDRLIIYTNKPVYAPGETVNIRALAFRLTDNYRPIAQESVIFLLRDDARRIIGSGTASLNAHGVANFSVPLPDNAPEGVFDVLCEYADMRVSENIAIRRRTSSLLTLEHSLPQSLAGTDPPLTFEVKPRFVHGLPPEQGQLRVRLRTADEIPFARTIPTTGAARYTFTWNTDLISQLRKTMKDGQRMYVELAWRDVSGHTESVTHTMHYFTHPHEVSWEPAPYYVTPGEIAKLPVRMLNRKGGPISGSTLTVTAPQGLDPLTTDKNGRAVLSVPITTWPTGISIEAPDRMKSTRTLGVATDELTAVVGVDPIREGRGFPLEIALGPNIRAAGSVVHVDITDRTGALVSAHLLPVKEHEGRFIARGTITAPTWGTALITMFCLGRNGEGGPIGLLVGGLEVEIQPNAALTVSLDKPPARVHPGQRVTLRGRVSDLRGNARTSHMSVSITEALAGTAIGAPRWDPQRLLYDGHLPVSVSTGETQLHWPVMSRNWGTARMDLVVPEEAAPDLELRTFGRFYDGGGDNRASPTEPKLGTHARARLQSRRRGPPQPTYPAPSALMSSPRQIYWNGDIKIRNGSFALSFTVPSTPSPTSEHRVTLVVSDERGGVGILEHPFRVESSVAVAHHLPHIITEDSTTQGRITLENNGAEAVHATVSLKASAKALLPDGSTRNLTVQPKKMGVVDFPLRAVPVSKVTLESRVRAKNINESYTADLKVAPKGVAMVTHEHGAATAGTPLEMQLPSAQELILRVSIPYRGVAADILSAITTGHAKSIEPGARATAAYYLALYLNGIDKLTEDRALAIRDVIAEDFVAILAELRLGKGLRSGKSFSPYLTARAIQGMMAAREANFPIPNEALQLAGEALLNAVGRDGLLLGGDPMWWEGKGKERQLSLTALVFRILAEAGPEVIPVPQSDAFRRMQSRAQSMINLTSDPLTVAHTGMGLIAHSNNFLHVPLEAPIASRILRRLQEDRKDGVWHPSWFASASGTINATVHALELTSLIDPQQSVQWLKESMPTLELLRHALPPHSLDPSTAALMRLLTTFDVPVEARTTTLTVEVNRRRAKRMTIAPNKPLGVADALRAIDLSSYLASDGKPNTVRITYSGELPATVTLTRTHYEESPEVASPWRFSRHLSKRSLSPGESTTVVLSLTSSKPLKNAIIEEPLPDGWHVTRDSLDQLVAKGRIASYEVGESLLLHVPYMDTKESIRYRVFAALPSELVLPPTRVRPMSKPESFAIAGEISHVKIR